MARRRLTEWAGLAMARKLCAWGLSNVMVSETGHRATEGVHHQFTDSIDLIRIGHPQQFLSFVLIGFL